MELFAGTSEAGTNREANTEILEQICPEKKTVHKSLSARIFKVVYSATMPVMAMHLIGRCRCGSKIFHTRVVPEIPKYVDDLRKSRVLSRKFVKLTG